MVYSVSFLGKLGVPMKHGASNGSATGMFHRAEGDKAIKFAHFAALKRRLCAHSREVNRSRA
jgi:hypothetical protein